MIAPQVLYPPASENTLAVIREVLSYHPEAAAYGPEEIAALVTELRVAPRRPEVYEVKAALEALRVEGQVLA